MKYTHDNGVTIERLASGALEARHDDWPSPVRSPNGVLWFASNGFLEPGHVCGLSIREALYAFVGLPGEEGDGDADSRSRYKGGALVVFADDTMTPIAGYLDTWNDHYAIISRTDTGDEYTVRHDEVIVLDPDAMFGQEGQSGGIPKDDAEPETYTGRVEDWPDGVYEEVANSDCQHEPRLVIVQDGRAFCSRICRIWYRIYGAELGVDTKFARVGDFDPAVLFGGHS